jgi:hypothetical protein
MPDKIVIVEKVYPRVLVYDIDEYLITCKGKSKKEILQSDDIKSVIGNACKINRIKPRDIKDIDIVNGNLIITSYKYEYDAMIVSDITAEEIKEGKKSVGGRVVKIVNG